MQETIPNVGPGRRDGRATVRRLGEDRFGIYHSGGIRAECPQP
jgi:hypothetical protein